MPSWWPYGLGGGRPWFLGDLVLMSSMSRREGTSCYGSMVDTFPRSLDVSAHVQWDLLPSDFTQASPQLQAASARHFAVLTGGRCRLPVGNDPACMHQWPDTYTMFLAMFDASGTPLDQYRCVPMLQLTTDLIWDGAQFVLLSLADPPATGTNVFVSTFDEDGTFTAWNARPSLVYDLGSQVMGPRLAAVGPNDYVIVYLDHSDGSTRIARFSLVPL
jgi:hypothetical protein